MVRCSQCQKELKLIAGHSTIRLYRCDGCGAQQLLPGAVGEALAQTAPPVTPEPPPAAHLENPIDAVATLIAQNPPRSGPKLSPGAVLALAIAALAAVVLLLKTLF